MKKKFLLGLLAMGLSIPLVVGITDAAPNGWVLNSQVSQSEWIKNAAGSTNDEKCTTVLNRTSCDYTGPSEVLRVGYEYVFADEFWAGDRDRQMRASCTRFDESRDYNEELLGDGSIKPGVNPKFPRTSDLLNNDYRVNKNNSMVVLKADSVYMVNATPDKRSPDNLLIKYVIEYSNDQNGNTRYQHTECYPYEISRCGDGVVDTDWYKKAADKPGEECDPAAPEWKNRTDGKTCSASCKIEYETPVCSSDYNGKKVYTTSSSPYLKGTSSEKLCNVGQLTPNTFKQTGTPIQFTWGCTNGNNSTAGNQCSLKQYRCGDGEVNGGGDWSNFINDAHLEECDPDAPEWKNRADGKSCNTSCKIEYAPSTCGTLNGNTAYNSNYSLPRITENTSGLCGVGKLVAGSLFYDEKTGKYTWDCKNGEAAPESCNAQDLWCGDGTVQSTYEQCDRNDKSQKGWEEGSWKTCNSSCKLVDIPRTGPVCSSVYNDKTKYTDTSTAWLSSSDSLCDKGSLIPGSFTYDGKPRTFTWSCTNDGYNTGCVAYQQWCGDGVKNGNEECDPEDRINKSGWGDGCSASCKTTYDSGVCGSKYHQKKTYMSIDIDWITEYTQGLCDKGTVTGFNKHTSSHVYTWQCVNHGKVSDTCRADQERCGDGIKNGSEECDGTEGCDSLCNKITQSTGCNQTFTGQLRIGYNKPFTDTFNAGWLDRYLFYQNVYFEENYGDHNNGSNPTFGWTSQLINNGMKVNANDSIDVIESTPYHIVSAPTRRAQNNIYIEYTIWYDNVSHSTTPSKSNLHSLKECVSYEISRCGDGVLDTNYGEECDPGSEGTKVLPDGRICNSDCKIVSVNPPLCNSEFHGKRLANLVNGSYLCREGNVGDFDYDEVAHKWTWTCSNVVGKEDCRAIKPYCGDGVLDEGERCDPKDPKRENWGNGTCNNSCQVEYPKGTAVIEKTLKTKIAVDHTGQVLEWEIRVTASGGDISDFEIQDRMPNVLTYSGWSLVSNPDGLNVKYRTTNNPQKSGNYNIYYWDAGGTLKSGHSIVMKVVTEVNKMPTSNDDYKNIACVIKDNKELDCDDDQPNTSVGTLKVEKTLIGPKEINKVGDIVQWTLKVRAVEGDVKNPIIRDKMPDVLGFTGYTVVHNGGLAISQPYLSGNRVTWYTSGGYLASGDYIEIRVDTYAKVMPEKEEENVLCAWPEDRPEYEDKICDNKPVHAPDLRIIKSFADGSKTKTVKIGEDIGYRITFGNSGTAAAKITSIKDFLPKNVEYGTSAIYIIKGDRSDQLSGNEVIDTNKKVEGVYVDIYGGITLAPHSTGYILLTGKVLSGYQDNRTNFACIYLNDKKIDCDDATHNIDNNVSCKPALNPGTFGEVCSSDNSTFSTTVTCKSSSDADIEIICNGSVVKTGHASQLTGTCSASTNNTDHKVQCKINGKTTGENGEVCEASFRRNTKSCGGPSGCFPAGTKVTMADGTTKNIEDVNEGDEVLSYNTNMNVNEGNVVTQKFVHANHVHEMYELTINGKVLKVTDVHPFYIRKSESSKDYDWIEAQNLKVGDILLMSDGNLAKIENINHYSNQETVYNLEVEGNHDYFVDEGYLVHNKPGPNPPDPDSIIYDPVNCFNINAGNASIQEGEILPFYWNVEKLSTVAQEGNYVEYKVNSYPYGEKDNYSNILKSDCTDDEDGHIALNSMLCSFEVTDGKGNSVRTLNDQPCLNSKTSKVQPALLSGWADRSIDKYARGSKSFRSLDLNNDKNYAFRSNVYYIDEFKAKYGVYGEYKLSLKQIKYARCENNKWEGRGINPSEGVECQSNFVVTNPYTVQKTPSGNLKASIERLSKYLYMSGDGVFQMSDLLNAIEVTQAAYEPNEAVKTAMDNFIKKYSKLAVSAGDGLKKVPGKNIYFVDKDINPGCNGFTVKLDKPVTFVQTQGNTTICGDVDYNMMLLTNGKITFRDANSCNHRQTVKGILYASGGIYRDLVKKNTKSRINESKRCTEGGLTIKGVLIGRGLQGVMDNSRSNLNNWFSATTNDKELKTKTIMNGASVIIEYSPSVFTKSSMPPGAEDFTTALSIYKQ